MTAAAQIEQHFASHPEPKCGELRQIHELILAASPGCRLWFSDGRDESGKIVANPTAGYGFRLISYADGTAKESFQIGLSANKTGISVYVMGLADKELLAREFGSAIGKAKVTGYCIRFRSLSQINLDVLRAAILGGLNGA